MMKSDDCLRALARHVTDEDIVVPVYTAAFDWLAIRPHPLNYLAHGVSIAEAAPRNLFHFVCENGTYEANGGHPIPNRANVDFAGFARSAGYAAVHTFSELKIFEQQVAAVLSQDGPVFATLKVTPSGPQNRDYSRLHGADVRAATKAALAR
jgi:sulfopyruvate decarboxylase subunit beta